VAWSLLSVVVLLGAVAGGSSPSTGADLTHPSAGSGATTARVPHETIVAALFARLDEVSARYRAGDRAAAALLRGAYLDQFEGEGLEAAVGAQSLDRMEGIEEQFVRIHRLMAAHAASETVAQELQMLKRQIGDAAALLARRQSPLAAFLTSGLLILWEGFEAILIVTALTAALVIMGYPHRVRVVYYAGGAAVVASLVTALLVRALVRLVPPFRSALEGMTTLLATVVLVYMSYWLTKTAAAERWQRHLRTTVDVSLGTGSRVALWSAAFLALYLEGAETVLLYQALLTGSDAGEGVAVLAGLGVGAFASVALFILLRSGAVRLPMRPLFAVTSAVLYLLAFIFAGRGVRTLQAVGLVDVTPATGMPTWEVLGVYPTWESLGCQLVLLAAAAVAAAHLVITRGRAAEVTQR
jgi:high-affinity iron transporter